MFLGCVPKLVADGNVNGAHIADLIGNRTKPPANLLKKRPIAIIIYTLELLRLKREFIEAKQADSLRAAIVRKRVLLELADQVNETEADRIQLHLAGLVAGPGARFFG